MMKIRCVLEGGTYRGSVFRNNNEKFCVISPDMETVIRELKIYLGVGVRTLVDFLS